jgi:hypothetical protein
MIDVSEPINPLLAKEHSVRATTHAAWLLMMELSLLWFQARLA